MTRFLLFVLVTGSALQAACSDAASNEPGSAGPDKPFSIVNGVISASSNDHGLEAVLIATHNEAGNMNVTRTSGEVCVNGTVPRAVNGDFARYWGLSVGFATSGNLDAVLPALGSSDPMIINPEGSVPWAIEGRVLGIAATISGPIMPQNLIFEATPGGKDPGGQFGEAQELTIYGSCNTPFTPTSGQRFEALFADLNNWWCVPQLSARWMGDSVIAFTWKVVSVIVNTQDEVSTDRYDFCLRDVRPILAPGE